MQDKPTGTVVGVVSDISREKRLAEQARREQEFRLSVLGSSAYGLEIGLESNRWKYLWRNGAADEIRESDDYDKDMLSLLMWYCFHSVAGQADEEAEKFERFLAKYSELTGGHGAGADRLFRGELLCARGELEQAELLADEALSVAGTNGQFSVAVGALLLAGRVAVNRMDNDGAEAAIGRLERLQSDFPYAAGAGPRRLTRTAQGLLAALIKLPQVPEEPPVGADPAAM